MLSSKYCEKKQRPPVVAFEKPTRVMIMITPSLFEVPRNAVLVDIPNHLRNEEFSKRFIEKFENFTDSLYDKHEVGYEKSQAITST